MTVRLHAFTEEPALVFDGDTSEGRDGLKEAFGAYQLDYVTWLPFAAKKYQVSPNIEDYVISVTPICPADLPNRNGYGFPLHELTDFIPPPVARQAYKAWAGCPMHYEHDNEDFRKAIGIVLDSSLTKVKGYGNGALWKVMGLSAVDKTKEPDIAHAVATKAIQTYSMGCDASEISCSYCGTRAQIVGIKNKTDPRTGAVIFDKKTGKPEKAPVYKTCSHINMDNDLDWYVLEDYEGKHLVYRNAHGLAPFEFSVVKDPAWTTACSDIILHS